MLTRKTPEGEIRIASVRCAIPRELRYDHLRYYVFVKRADGWWRSDPLFTFHYNEKYCSGTMVVRWNEQPGRTFAGIAANRDCVSCFKQGNEDHTLELMLRAGTATTSVLRGFPMARRHREELGRATGATVLRLMSGPCYGPAPHERSF